ncbi:MAG: BamA/TamA family outer membrane protein [Gemmatimonadetes bacterium]|nr:BamA/TamA family outer membrane protein [Gemmatimonadota bacterium]
MKPRASSGRRGWRVVLVLAFTTIVHPAGVDAQNSTEAGTSIIPFPFFFYTPETNLAFGATVIVYKTLPGTDRPSSLQPTFVYTVKSQIILSIASEAYLSRGNVRLLGSASFMQFPNTFWGVGNDAPDTAEEDYTPRRFSLELDLQRRFSTDWFVGGSLLVAHRRLVETEPGGLLATAAIPGVDDGQAISLGISLVHDSRDNIIYPRRGGYYQLRVARFDGMIGSDYDFTSYQLDTRQYLPVTSSHVLVFRGLLMATDGTAPFELLPQLGGEILLRGYFAGRYRDQTLLAFQSEYRLPVWRRIGAVGFVGVGQVADRLSTFAVDRFNASVGLGLRFLLSRDDQLNLRADFGFGEGSSGFYLGIGEVF